MKRLFALILICALCTATACAAEWPQGLSAAKPLSGVPEVDLTKKMGYLYEYPQAKLAAHNFCDALEIYLPREDIMLGDGHAHLFDSEGELCSIDFANPEQVELRTQDESELKAMRWGSGVCITMHLPVSLEVGGSYYVLLDLNCFLTADGKISNVEVSDPEHWKPVVEGDFGVNRLYYVAPPAGPTQEELEALANEPAPTEVPEDYETPAPTEAPEVKIDPATVKLTPEVGDEIHFDLMLGGDAKSAVVYSSNDSAAFDEIEYTQSGPVNGVVTREELTWGVVFLNENGEQVGYVPCR